MSLEFENSRNEKQNRVHEKNERDGSQVLVKLLKYFVEMVDGNATRDFVHMTGKAETVSEYPASLVVAMLEAIKRQKISDGVIRVQEMHFAAPVPDEGDSPTELEGKWGVDGTWIDPKLLIAGRKEEMEYMMKMGVFEDVDEKECYDNGCKPLMLKWVYKMKGEKCRSRLVCREIKKARDRDEQLGPEDVFSPMPPSEGLKNARVNNDDRTR